MYLLTGPIWDIVASQAYLMSFVKASLMPSMFGYNRMSYLPDKDEFVYTYELAEGVMPYVA